MIHSNPDYVGPILDAISTQSHRLGKAKLKAVRDIAGGEEARRGEMRVIAC